MGCSSHAVGRASRHIPIIFNKKSPHLISQRGSGLLCEQPITLKSKALNSKLLHACKASADEIFIDSNKIYQLRTQVRWIILCHEFLKKFFFLLLCLATVFFRLK